MNPKFLFSLSEEQRRQYLMQPDKIREFELAYDGDYELSQYVKDTSMRFWYNVQVMDFSTHWHEALEMIIPLEQGYTVYIQEEEYLLEPGDILIIPAGEPHSIHAPPSGARFIFTFEMHYLVRLPGFAYIQPLLASPIRISYESCPEIYEQEIRLVMELAQHYWSDSRARDLHIYARLLEFFSVYGDYCVRQREQASFQAVGKKHLAGKLNCIFDYLEQHFAEDITLEKTAAVAGFSKFYFTRLFKECTGQTFYDYLSGLRIKAAEQLLTGPAMPITEISMQCGFYTLSSFNRTFKQIKGCTPSEFRNLHSGRMRA